MARQVRFGILLTGDERGAVRSMKLTRQEARRLERQVKDTGTSADRSKQRFQGWAQSMTTLRNAIGPLIGAAGVGQITRMTQQAVANTAAIERQAETTGLGVERFQEYSKGLSDVGNILEDQVIDALRDFNQRLGEARQGSGEAAEGFELLGINLNQSTGPALDQTLRRLAEIESSSRRSALASQVFGEEAGPEIAAAMAKGHEAFMQAVDDLHELNRVMSEDSVEAATKLDRRWREFTDTARTNFQQFVLAVHSMSEDLKDTLDSIPGLGLSVPLIPRRLGELYESLQGDGTAPDVRETARELQEAHEQLRTMEQTGGGGFFGEDAVRQQRELVDQLQRRLEITRDLASGTRVPDDLVVTASQDRRASLSDMGVGDINIGTDMDLLRSRARVASRSQMGIGSMDFTGGVDMDAMARDVERMNELTTRRDQILRQIQTPQEKFNEQIRELRELEEAGVITGDQADRAFDQYRDQLNQARRDTEQFSEQTREMSQGLQMTFSSALEDSIIDFQNWRDVATSALEDVARIILRTQITQPLAQGVADFASGMFSGGGGSSNITAGNAVPRANGGPVNSGGTYLVGERGPELLHMRGNGHVTPNNKMGGVTVNVINQGGEKLEQTGTRRRQGPNGEQQVDVLVKSSMQRLSARGELDGIMGQFGAQRRGQR